MLSTLPLIASHVSGNVSDVTILFSVWSVALFRSVII